MSSRNIRLLIAYDGTDFCGWQIQKSDRTVQGVLEQALLCIEEKPVRVTVAGRTDSGVHATGQVANFRSESTVPSERYCHALNSHLPRDVRVLRSEHVDEDFHARYSARARTYTYALYQSEVSHPLHQRYCLTVKRHLDMTRLNEFASVLLGVHDFTTFSAVGDQSKSKIREVRSACFYADGSFIRFKLEANAFLWKMVRSLTGTILEFLDNHREPEELAEILEACNRSMAGTTAPAKGLTLAKVFYHV